MKPEVSVVLPVWNAAATIERAVRSILNQTLDNIEVLVIDDGSTDNTSEILRGIGDRRLQIFRSAHLGVASAANLGSRLANGRYIARMDADDIAHPARLQQQQSFLQEHRLDVVGCQVRIESANGRLTAGMQRYQRWINSETQSAAQIQALRFVEMPLVNPTLLARPQYFAPGFTDNTFPEDYDLLLQGASRGLRFGKVRQQLLTWTDSSTRLTRTHARYSRDAFMQCRRHHLRRGPLCGVCTVDLWGAGATGKPWLQWLQHNRIHVRQLIDVSPGRIGQTIHGVRVISPADLQPADGIPLVAAVGADGAREKIANFARPLGFASGRNLWFVA